MLRWLVKIIVTICIAVPAAAPAQDNHAVINLMFPAERLDINQFKDFAAEYGARINPVFYTNARLMMIRVRQSVHASPIDVLSTQLHNQSALQQFHGLEPLDHGLLPNLGQMNPQYLRIFNQDVDNKYTVPILGGTMCLLVDKTRLNPKEITSYADLWRPELQGRILIPEDIGTLLLLTSVQMGCEPQNADQELLDRVWEKMCALAENSALVTNNALEFLAQDNTGIAVALVYSPDAVAALKQNPNLVMVTPAEGCVGWVEALSIPANARNKELAHAYINYLMRPDVLANICRGSGYIPLNDKAYAMLQQRGHATLLSPRQLLESVSRIRTIALDQQYQARWHDLVEEKQF